VRHAQKNKVLYKCMSSRSYRAEDSVRTVSVFFDLPRGLWQRKMASGLECRQEWGESRSIELRSTSLSIVLDQVQEAVQFMYSCQLVDIYRREQSI
jgi:hypothetical protein